MLHTKEIYNPLYHVKLHYLRGGSLKANIISHSTICTPSNNKAINSSFRIIKIYFSIFFFKSLRLEHNYDNDPPSTLNLMQQMESMSSHMLLYKHVGPNEIISINSYTLKTQNHPTIYTYLTFTNNLVKRHLYFNKASKANLLALFVWESQYFPINFPHDALQNHNGGNLSS